MLTVNLINYYKFNSTLNKFEEMRANLKEKMWRDLTDFGYIVNLSSFRAKLSFFAQKI